MAYMIRFRSFQDINQTPSRITRRSGIAVLSMVIVIVAVMAIIAVSVATTSFLESASGIGESRSEAALRSAEAGAQDALNQLLKDADFKCTGTGVNCTFSTFTSCTVDSGSDGYQITVDGGTVCVKITNPASCPDTGNTIKARGTVVNKIRKIQITFDMDCNGGITQTAWSELTS